VWLPIEAVIEHNRLEVAETGEMHFLRGRGLLEGALARPQNAFAYGEEDVLALAVRLLAGIAQAHAFEQGNKRTAFEAMWHFLRLRSRTAIMTAIGSVGLAQSRGPVCHHKVELDVIKRSYSNYDCDWVGEGSTDFEVLGAIA
jgi:death-on-curing protein